MAFSKPLGSLLVTYALSLLLIVPHSWRVLCLPQDPAPPTTTATSKMNPQFPAGHFTITSFSTYDWLDLPLYFAVQDSATPAIMANCYPALGAYQKDQALADVSRQIACVPSTFSANLTSAVWDLTNVSLQISHEYVTKLCVGLRMLCPPTMLTCPTCSVQNNPGTVTPTKVDVRTATVSFVNATSGYDCASTNGTANGITIFLGTSCVARPTEVAVTSVTSAPPGTNGD